MVAGKKLPLYDMIGYHLGWLDAQGRQKKTNTGKYLRATLCLLGCESTGSDFRRALPLAGAIEYVHNFSLVHDDIQDNDRLRRHRPTVWALWGKPQAINTGSAMQIIAGLALHQLDASAQKQMDAAGILDCACLGMLEGQYLDISFEDRQDIGLDEYLDMIAKKTAALIQAALTMGACMNVDKKDLGPFCQLGTNLGQAFQIKDDILGIWGNDQKTGKPHGSDILKKKKSFPIVYLMGKLAGKKKDDFHRIYGLDAISSEHMKKIISWLDEADAQAYAQKKADHYYQKTLSAIAALPVKGAMKEHFKQISEFLVKREF